MVDDTDKRYQGVAQVLRERRTVHDFKAQVPPLATLEQAVELARWAPNHRRTEPWHFYLLDAATGLRVADLNADIVENKQGEKIAAVKRKRWGRMPGWLVVTCARSDEEILAREDYAACCCAIHNIALFLWDQGVGMKWTTGAVTRDPRFFELVGIDYNAVYVVGLFWYGFPTTVPTQHRKPVSEVLTYVNSVPPDG